MVDHSDHSFPTLLEFNRLWVSKFVHDSYLVFSTGRSLSSYTQLRKSVPLLTPDLLICSVGTEIYQSTDNKLQLDSEWLQKLDHGWDRDKIVAMVAESFSKLSPQQESEQRPHKISYHLQKEEIDEVSYIRELQDALVAAQLTVKVVYSGGIDVDILPECASKGLALQFLQNRWEAADELPTDGIQVNGDSGNDAELYEAPEVYGCVVANAMPELVAWADAHPSDRLFRASQRCTAGIMETMHHFGKVPDDTALPPAALALKALVSLYATTTARKNGSIPQDHLSADKLEGRMVTGAAASAATTDEGLMHAALVDGSAESSATNQESGGKELVWLDNVHTDALDGCTDGWKVTYDLCRMRINGERQEPVQHTAAVIPLAGAPEGYAVAVRQ